MEKREKIGSSDRLNVESLPESLECVYTFAVFTTF